MRHTLHKNLLLLLLLLTIIFCCFCFFVFYKKIGSNQWLKVSYEIMRQKRKITIHSIDRQEICLRKSSDVINVMILFQNFIKRKHMWHSSTGQLRSLYVSHLFLKNCYVVFIVHLIVILIFLYLKTFFKLKSVSIPRETLVCYLRLYIKWMPQKV